MGRLLALLLGLGLALAASAGRAESVYTSPSVGCPNVRQEAVSDAADSVVLTTGKFVIVNSWTAGRAITLPLAANYTDSAGYGCTLVIKDEIGTLSSTHVATITRAGSDQIENGNTYSMSTTGGALTLRSNAKPTLAGSGWFIDNASTHQSYDCSSGEQFAQVESAAGATTCADPAVQLLYINGVPIGIPGSGSIANNGALTAGTAFPTTFASIYLYFPANAIVAGSAAGFYYTVMSSTTAGIIKNNTYAPGTPPVIPASPTAFSTTGPGAYTQTTASDIAMLSTSVSAGALGINGALRTMGVLLTPSNTNTKTMKVSLGGTVASGLLSGGTTFASYVHNASGKSGETMIQTIRNSGSAAVQSSNGTVDAGSTANNVQYGVIDTTAAVNLIISGQLGTATDYIVLQGASVEKLK